MTRLNYFLMCLATITSLAGCYASVEPEHPRHARREEVIVHDDHHHDHDHWH